MSLPIHWREVIKKTSEQLCLPENEVKTIVLFYWKYFRKEMSSLNRTKVLIHGLGTFHIKPWKISKRIEDLKIKIKKEGWHGGSKRKIKIYQERREELRILKAIYAETSKELQRRGKIRKKQKKMKQEYYSVYQKSLLDNEEHLKIKLNLEKQMENSSGDTLHLVSK